MKRLMSCVLVLALALTMVPSPAFAAGTAMVAASSGSATPGGQVTITVYATTSDASFGGAQMDLNYDTGAFTVVSASANNTTLQSASFAQNVSTATDGKVIYLSEFTSAGVPALSNEALFTVTFQVKAGTSAGEYPMSLSGVYFIDESAGSMSVTPSDGSITVTLNDMTGTVTIDDDGTPQYGETLTATVTDGPEATLTYQWTRDGANIDGATNSTYVVAGADIDASINVIVSAEGYDTITAASGVTPAEADMPGTVAIDDDGTPQYGETLTVIPSGLPEGVSYQWYRGGSAISGATGDTYVVVEADIGASITVTASKDYYNSKTSSAVTPQKADQTPVTPVVSDFQDTTATLQAIPGAKFLATTSSTPPTSGDSGWQDSTSFSSLTSGTLYYFYMYYPADTCYNESPVSDPATRTTLKAQRDFSMGISGSGSVGKDLAEPIREGDVVTIYATPSSAEYKFTGWTATGTSLTDPSARSTTLTVGSDDIEIIGSFVPKDAPPSFSLSNTTVTYDGTVKSIAVTTSLPADEYQVCYYSDSGCTQPTTDPTDAGTYYAKAFYTATDDDSGYRTSEVGPATLTIEQQQEATPSVPTLSSKTSTLIAVDAETGCRYQILPAASASDDGGSWVTATETSVTFTNLTPGTAYKVWTYRHASDSNYLDSELNSAAFDTDHVYSFTVAPDTLSFFVRTGGTWTGKVVTVTNTGSIALAMDTTGLSADYDLNWSSTTLPVGGSVTLTITPKALTTATMSDYDVTNGTISGTADTHTAEQAFAASYKVADKNEVVFEGVPAAQSVVYNAANQAPDVSGITAYGLDELGTRTDFANGELTFTFVSQKNVGTQTVTVSYTDADFEGSTTFSFAITPAPITITEVPTAVTRVYDGTMDVTLTGGAFTGKLGSDAIGVYFTTSGTYGSEAAGTGKTVSYDAFDLVNNDQNNYVFATGTDTHPAITGTVEKKLVTPTVTAADKVYDGTTAATLTALVDPADIIAGDTVTVTYVGATFNSANAGSVSVASLGTSRTVEGAGSANYDVAEVETPSTLTAAITPRPLLATMSDMLSEVYNGQPHTATNVTVGTVCGSDNPGIVYQYDGSSTPPTLADTYTLSAVGTNTNYSLTVTDATMTIAKATLTPATYTSTIKAGNTDQHAVSVTDFGIPAAALAQRATITPAAPTGDDIFSSAPALNGGSTAVVFTLDAGALSGESANSAIVFTFNPGTYEDATANLAVDVASDTVLDGSITLEGTPTSILVGDSIPLSPSFVIKATFEEAGEQSFQIAAPDLSYVVPTADGFGYYATSELGEKTVTVTKQVTVGGETYTLTATFQLQVMDEITDVNFSLPNYIYERFAATQLNFTGAEVTPTFRTGIGSNVDLSAQDRTALFTTGVTLTDALRPGTHNLLLESDIDFNTVGSSYSFRATYTYNAASATNAIGYLTVNEVTTGGSAIAIVLATATDGEATPTNGTGSGSASAVLTGVGDNLTFLKVPGGAGATPGNIMFGVTTPSAGQQSILDQAVANAIAAGRVVSGSHMAYIVASLTDQDGDLVVMEDGSLRVTLPYPAGAGSTDTFVLVHTPLQPNGTTTATDAAIITDVVKGSITFVLSGPGPVAITWAPTQTSSDDDDDGGYYVIGGGIFTSAELDFWNRVNNALYTVGTNGVVYANAGIYDKMPAGVLTAIRNTGAILSLTWAGGSMIIDSYNAPGYNISQAYYPLLYLQSILGTVSANTVTTLSKTTSSSRNAISIGVPRTGDQEEAVMSYVPTPADAGTITAVSGEVQTPLSADVVQVVQSSAPVTGVLIGWLLVLLSVTAAAAYVLIKRKRT